MFKTGDTVLWSKDIFDKFKKGTFCHYNSHTSKFSFTISIPYNDEEVTIGAGICIPYKYNESLEGSTMSKMYTSDICVEEDFRYDLLVLVRNTKHDVWQLGKFQRISYSTADRIYQVKVVQDTNCCSAEYEYDIKVFKECIPFKGNEKYFLETFEYKKED